MSRASIVAAAANIVGDLDSSDDLRIDGMIEGNVSGRVVTIAETAHVKGAVSGGLVRVAGRLDGTVEAVFVEIAGTAHVAGEVGYQFLQVEEGARLDCALRRNAVVETETPVLGPLDMPGEPVAT